MIVLLALKLMLVPSLTAGITLSGRRWGPSVAGWLSAFPVVGGPILFFIAIEQGPAFASAAAVGAPVRVFAAPRGDMMFRMLASAVLVLLVTTFAAFCLALTLSLPALGIGPAFLLSLACAGTVQLGTRALMRRAPVRP